MAQRLNKITREFNVGISTIVEFLEHKGHKIESDPNTKVPDNLYDLLVKEFSSDIKVKKESDNVNLAEARKKKETISINDIEDSGHSNIEEEEFVPETTFDIKVVGKIDLERKKPHVPEPKPEEIEIRKEPVSVPENKVENQVKDVEIVTDEPEISIVSESRDQSEANIEDLEVEKIETIEKIADELIEGTAEAPTENSSDNRHQIENNVKVVGRIDLNSLNQKTRPDRKSKEEKDKERIQRREKDRPRIESSHPHRQHNQGQNQNQPHNQENRNAGSSRPEDKRQERVEDKPFKANVEKLTGPTVVGKIALPKTEVEDDDDKKKNKKKRKRIIKEKVPFIEDESIDKVASALKKKKKKKGGIFKKEEVSIEDVEKQVKDTLSAISSKGGKTKSSKYRRDKREAIRAELQEDAEQQLLDDKILRVTEFVSVNDLSKMMNVPVNSIISSCMSVGLFVSINQRLDAETISLIAEDNGYTVKFISVEVQESINEEEEENDEDLLPRAPIVTVMGHVDHGKTSLLDYIRKSNVIAGEAGGITQHIGAYSVILEDGKKITFLDTPGHEAFTAMRARGAKVTDLAIIVVAADDNVMPQTIEAINHAAAAGVPIIFAINKIDKAGANPDKIKEALANMNYLVEEWGGKYQSQEISAKFGKNVDLLLEKVLLEAEMLELKANPNKRAQGTIIESELDKGRGYISTLLVESGTLRVGDILLAGRYTGKVKAMFNERNLPITEAEPSTPVIILGLDGAPQAGDKFNVMNSDREAREIANKREQLQREQELKTQKHITLDEIGRRIAIGNFQELNVIVKGDVDGSVEALSDSLIKLSTEEIQVNVKHKAVGQISESDILLASASDAVIIGFQVRPSINARKLAEKEGIDIRLYSIIYDAINEIKDAMSGMLSPEIKEEVVATAEIKETFRITKVGTIAGCFVLDGKINRNSKVRIIRDGIVVYSGELASLKRHKDDVKEVSKGYECGLNIANFNDIKPGDIIEAFELKEFQRKL